VGVAPGADLRTDVPRYRIYRDGVMADEVTDITPFWRDDLVSFLLGCSFTFEWALLDAGIPMRHIDEVSPPEPAPQQPGVVERSEVEGSPRKPTRDRTNVKSFHNPVCQKPATTFERTGMSLKVCGSEIIEPDLSGIRLQPGTPIGRVRRAPKQRPATRIWIRQPA
jgi:hypothetical protein